MSPGQVRVPWGGVCCLRDHSEGHVEDCKRLDRRGVFAHIPMLSPMVAEVTMSSWYFLLLHLELRAMSDPHHQYRTANPRLERPGAGVLPTPTRQCVVDLSDVAHNATPLTTVSEFAPRKSACTKHAPRRDFSARLRLHNQIQVGALRTRRDRCRDASSSLRLVSPL